MTEKMKDGVQDKKIKAERVRQIVQDSYTKAIPDLSHYTGARLLRGAVYSLKEYVEKGEGGISWKHPFVRLEYGVVLSEDGRPLPIPTTEPYKTEGDEVSVEEARKLADYLSKAFLKANEVAFMSLVTRGIVLYLKEGMRDGKPYQCEVHVPPDLQKELDALPEPERDTRLDKLIEGYSDFLSGTELVKGTVQTETGPQDFRILLVFRILPLMIDPQRDRVFFSIHAGLDFVEGDPVAWPADLRVELWIRLHKVVDDLTASFVQRKEPSGGFEFWMEAAGTVTPAMPDRVVSIPKEYIKAPGRLFDTPRHIEAQKRFDLLPEISRWYMQTAFNRTVAMAAAALTKTNSRDAIFDWQSADINEIEDLVYCRQEEGTPARGQYREDILKAFEALRAVPVPIVRIDWKQIGTDRNPRWIKEYKLRVASLLQSYGAVFVDRKSGKRALVSNPALKKDAIIGKPDRRKGIKRLIDANPADGILKAFPADKYKLTGFEWRWNTDLAEDFICPAVALDKKDRPRRKPTKGRHIEGSRFIMVNKRYFAVQKHFRASGLIYAARLLDLIISEKTHITRRDKAAVWIEIVADKVIKWLGLGPEYQEHPKHVEEDHVALAVAALIQEKVLLPESALMPIRDPNPDRRKSPFYRWKVADLWSTVALVPEAEAKEIEDELVAKAEAEVSPTSTAPPGHKVDQAFLPGMEAPLSSIPSGADIRAAREAAGLNLRDFARMMKGASFNTWARIERGALSDKALRRITPDAWKQVGDFIKKHGSKSGSNGGKKEA